MTDATDNDRMLELWQSRLRAETDFERGYYEGCFEEYARQNAIHPGEFARIHDVAKLLEERGDLHKVLGGREP